MSSAARLNRSKYRSGAPRSVFGYAVLCLALVATFLLSHDAQARVKAIVVDAYTGEVLYSRHADYRHYPASLTKMMTLFLTFEDLAAGKLDLNQKLRVSRRASGQTPSRLGLRRGSKIKVRDAIMAVVVKSANDAATVLAEARGDTEIEFAIRMTHKAKALGMKRTRFRNASGLPNRKQVTTARDMAVLAAALFHKFPQYYPYFSKRKFSWGKRTHRSHNKLLGRYPGMDGLKTGYIRASGFNIATSATRNGRRLIAVVLGERSSKSRNAKVTHLLNVAFNREASKKIYADRRRQLAKPAKLALADTTAANSASGKKSRVNELVEKTARAAKSQVKRASTVLARLDKILRSGDKKPLPGAPASSFLPVKSTALTSADRAATQGTTRGTNLEDQVATDAPVPLDGKSWWGIQVGAYKRYASAQRRVHKAASVLPSILMHARPSIDLIKKRGKDLYRARLLGLRKEDARTACNILKGKSFSCVPISPSGQKVVKLASR